MKFIFTRHFRYYSTILFFLVFICNTSFAQILTGKVTDKTSNETLTGATVLVKETGQSAFVQLDGNFKIKNIKPATYNLTISFIGYEKTTQPIVVRADQPNFIHIKMKSLVSELGDVVITTSSNTSEVKARDIEKKADQLLNVVSSKAIELSPDITVGNVLQRVSGVSTERSGSGDGRYAIIRGLDKRYTYTSVNGIILPSPDPTQRSVPLDMFPAELVQRVEVYKSLTPDVDADAIAGATNMVMKEAPDHLTFTANLGTGLSTVFSGRPFSGFSRSGVSFLSPTEIYGPQYIAVPTDITKSQLNFHDIKNPLNLQSSFTLGDQLLKHKLGFFIGGSYLSEHRGSNRLSYPSGGVNHDPANQPLFSTEQEIQTSYLQSRLGLHGSLNYVLSPKHSFNLYGLFLQLDNDQHRSTTQTGISSTSMGAILYYDRATIDRKNLNLISLAGHDKLLDKLNADWTLSVSKAGSKTPDQLDLLTAFNNPQPVLTVSNLPSTWTHSEDQDKAAYLNLKYTPLSNITITAGGLYRNKNRNGFYNYYLENAGGVNQAYNGINSAVFYFIPTVEAGMGVTTSENIYSAHEAISAAYIEAKILIYKKLQLITGVRAETTDQGYQSMLSDALPGKSATFHYTDLLPGLHLKYSLNDKENLRLSYFAGLTRPTLYELIPSSSGVIDENTGLSPSGNYNLKHATGDNIDFRYDNFFSSTTYFLVGAFYKRINDPIEFAAFNPDGTPITESSTDVRYGPTNPAANATNYGLELVASKFIGKFGLSGNYSYIHSSVTTQKLLLTTSGGYPITTFPYQTRPLQGQADHIGNLSFIYKDIKSAFDAQLSFVYTGKRIVTVSQYYNLDTWQRATSQLDFSLNKDFTRHISFYFKMTNLLNNKLYQDYLRTNDLNLKLPGQTDPNRILLIRDEFKQTLLTGLKYKF